MESKHVPVLLNEAIHYIDVRPGRWYVDATAGGGGHLFEIVKKGGSVIGIDQDREALERVQARISSLNVEDNYKLVYGNFRDLKKIVGDRKVSGILLDLGLSSDQLADPSRGFSFQTNGPLDMRMDQSSKVSAADLVNGLGQYELLELLRKYGEVPYAQQVVDLIVENRRKEPIATTEQLREIVVKVRSKRIPGRAKIHPATQVFQALRIAVNDELVGLVEALDQVEDLLEPQGRLVVITFHSLEDRVVKNFMRSSKKMHDLTKKPIRPSQQELIANNRARSAKLRAAEKI
jgi:16S rRNA (cytosine1402-N4)-methyltransferase